jgi:hypothetical protein
MDSAVAAIQEQQNLEQEVNLLIKTANNLIEKLASRDKEIVRLRSELMLLRSQLSAFITVEEVEGDE